MPRTKKKPPDPYADCARSLDHTLLLLAASTRGASNSFATFNRSPYVLLAALADPALDVISARTAKGLPVIPLLSELPRPFKASCLLSDDARKTAVQEVDEVTPSSLRLAIAAGVCRPTSGPVLKHTWLRFTAEGFYTASSRYFSLGAGGRWHPLSSLGLPTRTRRRLSGSGNRFVEVETDDYDHSFDIELPLMLEWARPRTWRVQIGPAGCSLSLTFPTDPVGIRDLLRYREVSGGMTRRQALLHWVRQHYRKARYDPEALVEVRRHLRGSRECIWYDLRVRIHESAADLEANAPY